MGRSILAQEVHQGHGSCNSLGADSGIHEEILTMGVMNGIQSALEEINQRQLIVKKKMHTKLIKPLNNAQKWENYRKKYLTQSYFSVGSSVSLGACEPYSGQFVCAQKIQFDWN